MSRYRARLLLFAILLAGAVFRFQGLNWDSGQHLHPDERFISMVEDQLQGGGGLRGYLDSPRTKMNPYNVGFGSFVYGTLPMHAARGIAGVVGKRGYGEAFLFGRALSGLFDLVSVWLVYLIARRFAGRGPSLVAAGLLAASPLAIQLSHFWTVDTFLTTATAAALLASVRLAQGRQGALAHALTGGALGLAAAFKITGLALFLPAGVAMLLGLLRQREDGEAWGRAILRRVAWGFALLAAFLLTIRLALPYAFLGNSLLSLRLDPRWLGDIRSLTSLTSSVGAFPPNYQWAGRSVLFGVKNIVLWGAGPFFGLAAVGGLLAAVAATFRRRTRALSPLVLSTLFLLAYHGLTMVKAMRYHYPAYPALAVLAALWLERLARPAGEAGHARWRRLLPAVVLGGTFATGFAFTAIYRQEHTRVEASRWIYQHVPAGTRFANETWDDGLPLGLPGYDNGQWSGPEADVVGPDNRQKIEKLITELTKAGGIAITSNRAYGTLTRIPAAFPVMHAYYRALFDGRLGFRLAADIHSYPRLGPLEFPDDASDESFTVYDHPRVLLFRKTDAYSPERARAILLAALPPSPMTLADLENRTGGKVPVTRAVRPPRGGARPVRAPSELGVSSLSAAVIFFLALALVGAAAVPLTFRLFPRLSDRGAGIARLAGLAAATWTMMLLVGSGLAENGSGTARAVLAGLVLLGGAAAWQRRDALREFWRARRREILEGEAVFLAGFLLFAGLRALNPEIFWGEKPMDFSILNVLVRTRTLPASDPWFAGAPLGYYVFGQEMIAFLSLVTGLSTRFTFNLAFGLIGGASLQAAWSLLRNWTGRRLAAAAGAGLLLLVGNLAGLRDWLVRKPPLDWHFFWATSRVVPDTINEYPLWSLLFADLHAHVFAIPLLLMTLTAALQLVSACATPQARAKERLASAAVLGGACAVQALTNAWDVPLLFGLLALCAVASAAANPGWRGAGRAAAGWLVSLAFAVGLTLPLWVRGGGAPDYGWHVGTRSRLADVLTIFGTFLFLSVAWLIVEAWRALRALPGNRVVQAFLVAGLLGLPAGASLLWGVEAMAVAGVLAFLAAAAVVRGADRRLACLLIATAFFLVGLPQRVYIYDHMNTVFKLYSAAWVLFAVATVALAFGRGTPREVEADVPPPPGPSIEQWPLPLRAGLLLLIAAGLFTSVTATRGAIDARLGRPVPADYREQSDGPIRYGSPTLDGLAWLKVVRPAEAKAVDWLRANVQGTPVLLESQGASYVDFSRISGFTGIPTVLGWEHHVKQRGNAEPEVIERRDAIRKIYSSPTAEPILPLLRRYRVGFVYVGWLERDTYPAPGLAKFEASPEFALAYANPQVKIFRVVGGDTEDVALPVREILPGKPAEELVEPEEAPVIAAAPTPEISPFANLREPRGAAIDRQGRLWIADTGNNRLRLFDGAGGTLGGWGGRNDSPYGFREPGAVATDGERLYVADTWNGRVQAFSLADGKHLATAAGLFGPRGLAAAGGRVYVSDTGNHRVSIFDADLNPLGTAGRKGTGPEELDSPVGVAVGPDGAVYVADVINRRLQVLDAKGAIVRAIRVPGWSSWCEPYLAADHDGTLYIGDPTRSVVIAMTPDGNVVRTIGAGNALENFSRPSGIAIDRERRVLYVVDAAKNTVQTVALPPAPAKEKRPRRADGTRAPEPLGLSFARPRQGPSDVIRNTPPAFPADPPARGEP